MTNRWALPLKFTLALALFASACADPEIVPAAKACNEIQYRLCDATKECGGDVEACITNMRAVCAKAFGSIEQARLDDCNAALQSHGCNGTAPTFGSDGQACLTLYQ